MRIRTTLAAASLATALTGSVAAAQEEEPVGDPPADFSMRLAGFDRYHTAAMVEGLEYTPGRLLVFANSNGIDAFFASDNIAHHGNAWLLPVPASGPVPDWILNAIGDYTDVDQVIVIGGQGAVSQEVMDQVVTAAWLGAGPGR